MPDTITRIFFKLKTNSSKKLREILKIEKKMRKNFSFQNESIVMQRNKLIDEMKG